MQQSIPCRLCDNESRYLFSKSVLQKYNIAYFECTHCKSLQTESPYWLDEAYSVISSTDVGEVERAQRQQVRTFFLCKVLGLAPSARILDWGAGDGLGVRMMRDVGLNAFWSDKYARNRYARGFEQGPPHQYSMVTSIEVWEHFANPREEIEKIFSFDPEVVFVSTGLYSSQGSDWNYLHPLRGRHVFFYSEAARRYCAHVFGYHVLTQKQFSLFSKRPFSGVKSSLMSFLMSNKWQTFFRVIFPMFPKQSLIEADRKRATNLFVSQHPDS